MPDITLYRILTATAFLSFAALTVVLLFADRSTFLLGTVKTFILDTGWTVEQTLQIDLLDSEDIPGSVEHFGHAAIWGSGMLLFGWVLRAHVPLLLTALFVAGTSVIFEAAQPLVSATRQFEPADAIANFAGIVAAVCFLAVALWFEDRRARQAAW